MWQGAYVFDISLERGLELRGKITHCDGEDSDEERRISSVLRHTPPAPSRDRCTSATSSTPSQISKIGMNDLETLEEIGEISLS